MLQNRVLEVWKVSGSDVLKRTEAGPSLSEMKWEANYFPL